MRDQDFYTDARTNARDLWNAINNLKALQREWNARDFGNTLPIGAGENDGLIAADVGAVVFDSADALIVVLDSGHATNIAKLL